MLHTIVPTLANLEVQPSKKCYALKKASKIAFKVVDINNFPASENNIKETIFTQGFNFGGVIDRELPTPTTME